MRILFLTQYYSPETGAAQNRIADLTRRLAGHGHQVTVLTAVPNYPLGQIFQAYRGKIFDETIEADVKVIRTWVYATNSKKFLLRLANFISFTLMSFLVGLWRVGKQDFVILEAPPLFLGLSALLLSRVKRARLITNVSDLWLESAVALGVLQEGLLLRCATRFEDHLFRVSVLVTGQTEGIVENIRLRLPQQNVLLQPNGVNTEVQFSEDRRRDARRRVREEYGFDDKFVVGYTGLHGLAQGLETVLESAELLREAKPVMYAFFGDGPEKETLVRHAQERKLDNVSFYPPQPAARMAEILAGLDVALVPLKRHPLFRGALPSKLFESMGAGLPVIVSIEGEAKSLVERAHAGICVEPEDPAAIADAILTLSGNPDLCARLGGNGRCFVAKHYNRAEVAERLNRFLVRTASETNTPSEQLDSATLRGGDENP